MLSVLSQQSPTTKFFYTVTFNVFVLSLARVVVIWNPYSTYSSPPKKMCKTMAHYQIYSVGSVSLVHPKSSRSK